MSQTITCNICVVEGEIHNDLPKGSCLRDSAVRREGIQPQDHKQDHLNHDSYWGFI